MRNNRTAAIAIGICLSLFSQTARAAGDTAGNISARPEVYMEDSFNSCAPLPGEQRTNASGWDVSGNGGYITGRNTLGGFYLVDTSRTDNVVMEKSLAEIGSGTVKWEISVAADSVTSVFFASLGHAQGSIVSVELRRGELYYHTLEGAVKIGTYVADETIKITSYINMDTAGCEVWRNGIFCGNVGHARAGSIVSARFASDNAATGALAIKRSYLSRNFSAEDNFDGETGNLRWRAEGGAQIRDSILLTAASGVRADIEPENGGTLAAEFRFRTYDAVNTDLAGLSSAGDTVAAISLTAGGKISASNGTELCSYVPGVWYNGKIELYADRSEADIYINHMKKATVPVRITAPDEVFFENSDKSVIAVDDVCVRALEAPEDYVPTPIPVKTDYYTSVLSCGLWREAGGLGWDAISGFDERTPVLGFYDQGNPEVSDWEIKFMTEHGIDSQIFCWYDEDVTGRDNSINAYKDARYSDMLDYSVLWVNDKTDIEKFRTSYVPFWIEHYFKDPRYTQTDGKPVLYIFNNDGLMSGFGGSETAQEQARGVKEQLDYLNDECVRAGLGGIKIFVYNASPELQANGCVAGSFTYGYNISGPEGIAVKYPAAARENAVPVLAVRQNNEAWSGKPGKYTTPASFYEQAKVMRDNILPGWNYESISDSGTKMLILDNWNEYGEGHFLMPTETFGFAYLDAFRSVFAGGEHTDTMPSAGQLRRINMLYRQDRRRRDGSSTESSDRQTEVVKLWDFKNKTMNEATKAIAYEDGSKIVKNGSRVLDYRLENGLLKGTVNHTQALIAVTGISGVNLSEVTGVRIRCNSYTEQSCVYFESNGSSGYKNAVFFDADWSGDIIRDFEVDMTAHEKWNGALDALFIRIPVSVGYDFEVESIALVSEREQRLGAELVSDGSFERGTSDFRTVGCVAEITHNEFNRGAAALALSDGGTMVINVPGIAANTKYRIECSAKLPYSAVGSAALSAYISYSADGGTKTSNVITLEQFNNRAFARLSGEVEIGQAEAVTDARLCIEGSRGYVLDDVSVRAVPE